MKEKTGLVIFVLIKYGINEFERFQYMIKSKKISKSEISSRIVAYEIAGFFILIVIMWLNELLDLPHILFKAPATPENYAESCFETAIVLILCFLTVWSTVRLLRHIKHLQGIIPICSFCKKVRVDDDGWIPVDQFIKRNSSADFSHGLCPKCLDKYYEDKPGGKSKFKELPPRE